MAAARPMQKSKPVLALAMGDPSGISLELTAKLLADKIGGSTGIGVIDALTRVRRTKPQASLPLDKRADNVKGAFAISDRTGCANMTVLLVDDVLTSLHTVSECARVLLDTGATAVYVLGIARGI